VRGFRVAVHSQKIILKLNLHIPMLKIKNTLTKELTEFQPLVPGQIKMYQCGPTVYSRQHIGNLRAAVLGDLVRRSLMYLGYEVMYVRNITDVGHLTSDSDTGEDKMAKGVRAEGLAPQEIAAKYTEIYHQDLNELNVMPPTAEPTASGYVHAMQEMIQILLDKGFAYITPSAVYFDISKAEDYTRLSGQKLELNQAGAGHGDVEDVDHKRNPADFALWFFKTGAHANALQVWQSPFDSPAVDAGLGLPGWHIECSAMIKDILGTTIDIHLGGVEHIPVHHTNEIAQSESANEVEFVRYWLHNEHLQLNNGKMAKSEGNVVYLDHLPEHGLLPISLRYFFLQSHYRSKQNFTWEAVTAADTAYKKLRQLVASWAANATPGADTLSVAVDTASKTDFVAALEDDFNLPAALAVVWQVAKDDSLSSDAKLRTVLDFDQVLGLKLDSVEDPQHTEIPAAAQDLLAARAEARANKDWTKSDELRDQLKAEFGLEVKDTAAGQTVNKI
jgi:cysteinyl-tRNA synthetase